MCRKIYNCLRKLQTRPLSINSRASGSGQLSNRRQPCRIVSANSGQIAVLMMFVLPLLIILLSLVSNVALTVITKARLQVTADKAASAAGKVLAEELNRIALTNNQIRREFSATQKVLSSDQRQSRSEGAEYIKQKQEIIDELHESMNEQSRTAYQKACAAALQVVQNETPWAEMLPLYGRAYIAGNDCLAEDSLFELSDNINSNQIEELTYTYPEGGGNWWDPASVGESSEELLQYLLKPSGKNQQAAFALRLRTPIPETIIEDTNEIFTTSNEWIEASAAVQPFGGSIEDTAFLDVATDEDLLEVMEKGDLDYDYTLVPLSVLQNQESGYRGLEYLDENSEWVLDEDQYAQ